ncbi:MAG: ankyrin repeat domain-containing protein [Spirochaetales bacterium]|nr:ankyrin repeat domain-containing protein [Spirochaetales bacterium]
MRSHISGARQSNLAAVVLLVGLLAAGGLAGCRVLGPAPAEPDSPAAARPKAGGLPAAAEQGDLDSARAAVERNPALVGKEDEAGWSAAAHAAWNGHKDVYDYLIAQGAPASVFTEAALGPLQALVERLQNNPRAANAQDGRYRAPPLTWAVRTGNRAAVEYLLDMGADVNLADRAGRTPLHASVSAGQLDIARTLVHAGADPGAADTRGQISLHLAAAAGDLQFCLLLLEAGAPLDAQDDEGNTPLHLAAAAGDFELCEYLLFLGADAGLTNARGLSPGGLAAEGGHRDVAELLRLREE